MRRAPRVRGRLLGHPAEGLFGNPEPDLVAVRVELDSEPDDPVRFPHAVAGHQDLRPAGPVPAPSQPPASRRTMLTPC